jgi:hypothetical protein
MERRNRLVLRQRNAHRAPDRVWCGERRSLSVKSLVVAVREIQEGWKVAPRGAVGVVTHVFAHGVGYEVRFSEPDRVILCASRADLELI